MPGPGDTVCIPIPVPPYAVTALFYFTEPIGALLKRDSMPTVALGALCKTLTFSGLYDAGLGLLLFIYILS